MAVGPQYCHFLLLLLTLTCILPLNSSQAADVDQVITRRVRGEMKTKQGSVRYQSPTKAEAPADPPQIVVRGDRLRTLRASRASLVFLDRSNLQMTIGGPG